MNGKGDTPRPLSVDRETFESNWERIFANSKNVDDHTEKDNYIAELKSGMFWERYPTLTGNWEEDKSVWLKMKNT